MLDIRKKVFVCDDDSDMVHVICDIMVYMNLESTPCSDSRRAIETIEKTKPDIIISDIQMPIFSGLDLIRSLNEKNYRIPIIFLTGRNEIKIYHETFVRGHFEFLKKPLDPYELIKTVDKALNFGYSPPIENRFFQNLKKASIDE
ncbi:MAG TPA: response regulator [Pseudobdellovibrionaceae bacterium]|jgi:FixJ family two-component response regulator